MTLIKGLSILKDYEHVYVNSVIQVTDVGFYKSYLRLYTVSV